MPSSALVVFAAVLLGSANDFQEEPAQKMGIPLGIEWEAIERYENGKKCPSTEGIVIVIHKKTLDWFSEKGTFKNLPFDLYLDANPPQFEVPLLKRPSSNQGNYSDEG